MITVSTDNTSPPGTSRSPCCRYIIAQPNCSASWQTNKIIIVITGLMAGMIAALFSAIGAWLILPVAGIEITALGSALYVVCRQTNRRHVIRFNGQHITVEKGLQQPQHTWHLNTATTAIFVDRQSLQDPLKITLYCQHDSGQYELIPIGDFLNNTDSQQLLVVLREQGLRVNSDSSIGRVAV